LCTSLLTLAVATFCGCRKKDFPEYGTTYREFAYIANGGSNSVTVLDVVNLRQDRVIAVGEQPTGIAASPTRNEIYVVNAGTGNGSVSVIDAETNTLAATVPVHRRPYSIEVDKAGERAYVANSGSNNVSVIDLRRRREIALIGTGEAPGEARISPDNDTLVVTNRVGNSVSIFSVPPDFQAANTGKDVRTYKLRAVFPNCPGATDAVILPDSSKAFVACSGGHQVMVLGLVRAAGKDGEPAQPDRLLSMLDVGRTPVHLALKPDGGELFVSNFDSDTISEIATQTNEVGGAYLVGAHPARGLVSGDNSTLWISNFNADTVSVYSIDDGKITKSVRVGDGPDALAFSAAGHLLFAVNARSGDVSVVRTSTLSLFTMLPAGRQPNAIVVKAFRVR
jgi:YVTN family beta-propeller protein